MNSFVRKIDANTFLQQVIFVATHGNSSRYASNTHCLRLKYTNSNGNNLGIINAVSKSFNTNTERTSFSFTLDVNSSKEDGNDDVFDENLIVFYTAHK
jgi:hypothetical protein